MKLNKFYNNWKNKSKQELQAIKSIEKAIKIIFKKVPKKEIVSIFVRGSFVRREMIKNSDVDIIVALKTGAGVKIVKKIQKFHGHEIEPSNFTVFSIRELKLGKRFSYSQHQWRPDNFLMNIDEFRLLYGENINFAGLPQRKPLERLLSFIKSLKFGFIPMYNEDKVNFDYLLKQVMWLVQREILVRENRIPFTTKELDKAFKNKNHIIHETVRLRNKGKLDPKTINNYFKKLNNYMDKLKKEFGK